MIKLKSITPNFISNNLDHSIAFYRDALGFTLINSVDIGSGTIWAHLTLDEVSIMLQERTSIETAIPSLKDFPIGACGIMFIIIDDLYSYYDQIKGKVNVIKSPEVSFYNHVEFTIADPDGYFLTFSQPLDNAEEVSK